MYYPECESSHFSDLDRKISERKRQANFPGLDKDIPDSGLSSI